MNIQDLAIIGRLLNEGRVDRTKVIAVAGSEVKNPQYYRLIDGAPVASVLKDNLKPTAHNPASFRATCLRAARPRPTVSSVFTPIW